MINKQKNEKNIKPKSKNNINPSNKNIKSNLLSSQINLKVNSNKSQNKLYIKKIKNNSSSNFIDKKFDKKENIKKVNLRNINLINERQKTMPTKNDKIIKRINTTKTKDNLFKICKLSQFLKNTDLKQTIIIDDQGNNNLNLIIKEGGKNVNDQKGNNKKEIKKDFIKEEINDKNNSGFTSLFLEASNKDNIINIKSKKHQNIGSTPNNLNIINLNKNSIRKNEAKSQDKDNKRIDEYSQLFKLLNENIEQFKNIIHKKDTIIENKEKKKNINNNKNKKKFFSSKETYNNNNSEKRIKSKEKVNNAILFNKTQKINYIKKCGNKNYNTLGNKSKFRGSKVEEINTLNFSKEKNISNIYSFLDSFSQEDLFQPLDNKHQKKSSKSLTNIFKAENRDDCNYNKKIIKKEVDRISSNEMSTNNKCDDEEIQISGTDEHIKYDKLKNRNINPHFFSNDSVNKDNKDEKKNVNMNKDCLIF